MTQLITTSKFHHLKKACLDIEKFFEIDTSLLSWNVEFELEEHIQNIKQSLQLPTSDQLSLIGIDNYLYYKHLDDVYLLSLDSNTPLFALKHGDKPQMSFMSVSDELKKRHLSFLLKSVFPDNQKAYDDFYQKCLAIYLADNKKISSARRGKDLPSAFQVIKQKVLSAVNLNQDELPDFSATLTSQHTIMAKKGDRFFKICLNDTPTFEVFENGAIREMTFDEMMTLSEEIRTTYSAKMINNNYAVISKRWKLKNAVSFEDVPLTDLSKEMINQLNQSQDFESVLDNLILLAPHQQNQEHSTDKNVLNKLAQAYAFFNPQNTLPNPVIQRELSQKIEEYNKKTDQKLPLITYPFKANNRQTIQSFDELKNIDDTFYQSVNQVLLTAFLNAEGKGISDFEPTLVNDECIISKKGNIFYKITLGHPVLFEALDKNIIRKMTKEEVKDMAQAYSAVSKSYLLLTTPALTLLHAYNKSFNYQEQSFDIKKEISFNDLINSQNETPKITPLNEPVDYQIIPFEKEITLHQFLEKGVYLPDAKSLIELEIQKAKSAGLDENNIQVGPCVIVGHRLFYLKDKKIIQISLDPNNPGMQLSYLDYHTYRALGISDYTAFMKSAFSDEAPRLEIERLLLTNFTKTGQRMLIKKDLPTMSQVYELAQLSQAPVMAIAPVLCQGDVIFAVQEGVIYKLSVKNNIYQTYKNGVLSLMTNQELSFLIDKAKATISKDKLRQAGIDKAFLKEWCVPTQSQAQIPVAHLKAGLEESILSYLTQYPSQITQKDVFDFFELKNEPTERVELNQKDFTLDEIKQLDIRLKALSKKEPSQTELNQFFYQEGCYPNFNVELKITDALTQQEKKDIGPLYCANDRICLRRNQVIYIISLDPENPVFYFKGANEGDLHLLPYKEFKNIIPHILGKETQEAQNIEPYLKFLYQKITSLKQPKRKNASLSLMTLDQFIRLNQAKGNVDFLPEMIATGQGKMLAAKKGDCFIRVELNETPRFMGFENGAIRELTQDELDFVRQNISIYTHRHLKEMNIHLSQRKPRVKKQKTPQQTVLTIKKPQVDKKQNQTRKKNIPVQQLSDDLLDQTPAPIIAKQKTADKATDQKTSFETITSVVAPKVPLKKEQSQVTQTQKTSITPKVQLPVKKLTKTDDPTSTIIVTQKREKSKHFVNQKEDNFDYIEELENKKIQQEKEFNISFQKMQALLEKMTALPSADSLLIAPQDMPKLALERDVSQFVNLPFEFVFGERVCYDFYWEIKALQMKQRFNSFRAQFSNAEDLINFDTPPIMAQNNVLYQKKKNLIYQISLDKNNPYFCVRDLITKSNVLMPFKEVLRVVCEWLDDDKKADNLNKKLKELYQLYDPENAKTPPLMPPSFSQVYNAYHTHFEWLNKCSGLGILPLSLKTQADSFYIPPTIIQGGYIASVKGNFCFVVDLKQKPYFYKSNRYNQFLMNETDFIQLKNMIKKANLFGAQTDFMLSTMQDLYQKTIKPHFENSVSFDIKLDKTSQGMVISYSRKEIQSVSTVKLNISQEKQKD